MRDSSLSYGYDNSETEKDENNSKIFYGDSFRVNASWRGMKHKTGDRALPGCTFQVKAKRPFTMAKTDDVAPTVAAVALLMHGAAAWTASGGSQEELAENLRRDGRFTDNRVGEALRRVDRIDFVPDGLPAGPA